MAQQLKNLFSAIAEAKNELQLQENAIEPIGEYFEAKRYRLFLRERLSPAIERLPLFQVALSLDRNPVLRYVVDNHIPVHEGIVLTTDKWRTICPRFERGHVMVGPIVNHGSSIGGLAFTRDRSYRSFSRQNLLDLSALCLHISTQLTTIQSQSIKPNQNNLDKITPRELQIAKLVAQGFTNKNIGKNLWITENSVKQALKRMFRKLNVSSRAEMVALLSKNSL